MIIAVIILSILLTLSALLNVLIYKYVSTLRKRVQTISQTVDQILGNIKDEEIEEKFENVTLIFNVQKANTTQQVFDTSLYLEKNIIGLTYFVQEQDYGNLRQAIYTALKKDGFEEEEIQEIWEKPEIIPEATVYKMKDGRWIWYP